VAEENVQLARFVYASLNRGDVDTVLDLLDPDVEWWTRGDNPDTSVTRGRDGFKRLWHDITDVLDDFRMEPTEMIDAGDYVITAVSQVARTRGATIEQHEVHVGKFRDGKIIELREYHDMAEALKAVGLKE
jgi:ketosteroid isomerase-like protein